MPADLADAKPGTVYYGEMYGAEVPRPKYSVPRATFEGRPIRTRRVRSLRSCHANLDSGEPCPHAGPSRRQASAARRTGCPKAGKGSEADYCSVCKTTGLSPKRRPCHDGSGMCQRVRGASQGRGGSQRRHQGPIQTGASWEERVWFDLLLPLLVTYADGTPFPPDQRDERKGGGLGTSVSVTRGRECDTTTNRFPDSLWILRDERARAVLALSNELDEHSHTDRKPTCESGKIDDTFQAVQNKLGFEGAARGARRAHDAHMIPSSIRTNPNATTRRSSSFRSA